MAITFEGIDRSNEISLLEFGLLVSDQLHEDGSGTRMVIYKKEEDSFGTGHISEKELNRILSGKDWADKKSLKSFYSYVGIIPKDYKKTSFIHKLYDLISYYGYQNIMGTDYCGLTEKETVKRYLN